MFAVDEVLFDWGLIARADREAPDAPTCAFSVRVNERAAQLGDDPSAIKARIRGDIALLRAQIGDIDLLSWT